MMVKMGQALLSQSQSAPDLWTPRRLLLLLRNDGTRVLALHQSEVVKMGEATIRRNMGVSMGGCPIAGWLISWNIPFSNG